MADKIVFRIVLLVTIFVMGVVIVLNAKILPQPEIMPGFVAYLPGLHAILNGTCSVILVISFLAIRKKNISLHKKLNFSAFILSSLFLISYILAHFYMPDVKYGDLDHNGLLDDGEKVAVSGSRGLYLFILLTHIVLAALILPFILISFWFGINNRIAAHKKIVRFTFPIWLYVTITGVVVFLMVKDYYPFP